MLKWVIPVNRKFFLLLAGLWISAQPCRSASPFFIGKGPPQSFRSFEDDRGGFYLVWGAADPGGMNSLVAQHFNADGRPAWVIPTADPSVPGLLVSSAVLAGGDWFGLADGQGGLTLFWDESGGVYARRFGAGESPLRLGNSVLISTSAAVQPDAVPDAVGGTLIVWRESLSSGRSVVMAQRLDPQGKPLWPLGGLRVSLRASNQTNPRVVYDNMSGMIVAWRDEANSASELRVQRIDFAGNRLWNLEGLKITAPVGTAEYSTMASVGTGSAVIAWTGSVSQTNQILLQKVGPESALKWDPAVYASKGQAITHRWNPVLLADEARGIWISWEDFRNQGNYQILLNRLDGNGSCLWPKGEIAVAPAPGDQGKMTMASDGKDGVWLAWIDNRMATVGLYVQDVGGSGARLLGPGGRVLADRLTKPSKPQLVTLGPGKAAVCWVDQPKKGTWMLFWAVVGTP